MLDRLALKNLIQCSSQHVKRISRGRVMTHSSSRKFVSTVSRIMVLVGLRILKSLNQRISQRVKWISGGWDIVNLFCFVCGSLNRSLDQSLVRLIARSIARSLERAVARLLDGSFVRSIAHYVDRSLGRSIDRTLDRSFVGSPDRSLYRSSARSQC